MERGNFWEKYSSEISPKLKQIDIYMKSGKSISSEKEVSELLYIPAEEVKSIMRRENISSLDKRSFFLIMKHGSSLVCEIFARELALGIPEGYTPDDISYIYGLDINKVLEACKRIGKTYFLPNGLKELFANIKV